MDKDNVTPLHPAANEQPAAAPKTIESYSLPAPMVQDIVNTLGSLPWGQVNSLMQPLLNTIQQQAVAHKG